MTLCFQIIGVLCLIGSVHGVSIETSPKAGTLMRQAPKVALSVGDKVAEIAASGKINSKGLSNSEVDKSLVRRVKDPSQASGTLVDIDAGGEITQFAADATDVDKVDKAMELNEEKAVAEQTAKDDLEESKISTVDERPPMASMAAGCTRLILTCSQSDSNAEAWAEGTWSTWHDNFGKCCARAGYNDAFCGPLTSELFRFGSIAGFGPSAIAKDAPEPHLSEFCTEVDDAITFHFDHKKIREKSTSLAEEGEKSGGLHEVLAKRASHYEGSDSMDSALARKGNPADESCNQHVGYAVAPNKCGSNSGSHRTSYYCAESCCDVNGRDCESNCYWAGLGKYQCMLRCGAERGCKCAATYVDWAGYTQCDMATPRVTAGQSRTPVWMFPLWY